MKTYDGGLALYGLGLTLKSELYVGAERMIILQYRCA